MLHWWTLANTAASQLRWTSLKENKHHFKKLAQFLAHSTCSKPLNHFGEGLFWLTILRDTHTHKESQVCANLVPHCGQWCINWLLTDEALTFYSGPRGQFSASWNCGGLHPLTLECFSELWPCGRIIEKDQTVSLTDEGPYRWRDKSWMQKAGEMGTWMPQNETHSHLQCHPIPNSVLWSLLQCSCLWGFYPQPVHDICCSGVSPQAIKHSLAVSK